MIKVLLVSLLLFVPGCFFARVDYEKDDVRVSATVWTIGKSYYLDPNSVSSTSQKINFAYPFVLETE